MSRNVNAATPTAAVRRSSRDALDIGATEIVSKVDGVLDQQPRRLRDRLEEGALAFDLKGFEILSGVQNTLRQQVHLGHRGGAGRN